MCECRASAAADSQSNWRALEMVPADQWTQTCLAVLQAVPVGRTTAYRRCGVATQGGLAGLHHHHLTVHPDMPWTPVPGHP